MLCRGCGPPPDLAVTPERAAFVSPDQAPCSSAPFSRFIKGFIYRNYSRCPENEYFLDYIRYSFLMNLKRNLPKNVLDKSWPTPPPSLREVGWAKDVEALFLWVLETEQNLDHALSLR